MRLDETTESVLRRCAGLPAEAPLPPKILSLAVAAKRAADRVDSGIPFTAGLCGLIVAFAGMLGSPDPPPPQDPVPAAPPLPPDGDLLLSSDLAGTGGSGSGAGDGSGGPDGDFDPTLVPPSPDPPVVPDAGPDFSADLGLAGNRNPFDDKPNGTALVVTTDDGTERAGTLDGAFGPNRIRVAFPGDTQRYRVVSVERVRLA